MRQRWADYRVFWRQFRQAYNTTGSLLPSSRGLAVALTRFVRSGEAAGAERASAAGQVSTASQSINGTSRRILEVGPGTGAITVQIIHDMQPHDRLVLVERNEQFVAHLESRLSKLPTTNAQHRISLMHASVEDLP